MSLATTAELGAGSAPAPTPERILHGASSGDDVRAIQSTLKALGHDPGALDGVFGPRTADAVRNYQQDRGLPVDGIVSPVTWNRLLTEKDSKVQGRLAQPIVGALAGDDVRAVQEALRSAGFATGGIDGVYGPRTAKAVHTYQRVHALPADGIVGLETSAALLHRRLRLSESVAAVVRSAANPVTASDLAARIFESHPEYANRSAGSASPGSSTDQSRDPIDWLVACRELFDHARAPVLHGRLFVIGLSLLDDSLQARLHGAVQAGLRAQLREPLASLLSPRGKARLMIGDGEPIAERLSETSIRAFEHAVGLSRLTGRNHVHTEHLLLGLTEKPGAATRLLARHDIDTKLLAELLYEAVGWTAPSGAVSSESLTTLPPLSNHVRQAIVNAFVFASAGQPLVVHSRHLLQGLLSVTDCSVTTALSNKGIPIPEPGLIEIRATRMPGAINDTVPEPGQGRVRTADRLHLDAEVEMLATVSLAVDTPLPLAVGLFGNWGTGKSFFMAMLQERIDELAQLSRGGRPEGAPFCGQVRQVRFNAWHYVDETSLWASLAETIFEGVARPPSRADEKLAEIDAACQELKRLETDRLTLVKEVDDLAAEAGRSSDIATTAAAAITAFSSELPQIGLPPGSAEALATATTNVRSAADEASSTWSLVGEELLTRRRSSTVVCLAVVITVGLMMWVVAGWSEVVKVIASVGLAATAVLGLAKRGLLIVQNARLERERPLRDAERRLQAVRGRESDTRRMIADGERALAELSDSGRQLHDFLRDRRTSVYYRDRLGVISAVRRDFENLVALIKAANRLEPEVTAAPSAKPEMETRAAAAAVAAAEAKIEIPAVERIILYIDDLDRCPADKVVDVLHAVHLLMAFELFVVVVGVDSRWLERSLKAHFATLLDEPERYLEKIFQIPFALRPMSRSGYRDLIDQLTPPAPPHLNRSPEIPDIRRSVVVQHSDPAEDDQPTQRAGDREVPEPTPPTEVGKVESGEAARILPRPEALFLSDRERDLLRRLDGIVPTPRATKRLVNIYRMLRVSVPADEIGEFEPGGGDEYQVVGLLLGILIGRPEQVRKVFGRLARADPGDDIWCLLEEFRPQLDPLISLRPLIDVTDVGCYQRWLGKVSRFSFRLSKLPEQPFQERADGSRTGSDTDRRAPGELPT